MPVDILSHQSYGARSAKYNADRAAAATAGDEVAAANAEKEWSLARMEMERDLYERQASERDRTAELARIKAENPAAPPELFEGTDLAQMERAAKAVQALAAQQTQGSWSPPPSSGGGGGGAPADDNADFTVEDLVARGEQRNPDTGHFPTVEREMDKLSPTVMARGALARKENEELQRLSIEPVISKMRVGKTR